MTTQNIISTSKSFYIQELFSFIVLVACLFAVAASAAIAKEGITSSRTPSYKLTDQASLPALPFIANQGQLDNSIAYYTRTAAGGVAITTRGEMIHSLPPPENSKDAGLTIIKEVFGKKPVKVSALQPTVSRINSYIGNDPAHWQENIPTYKVLSLGEIHKGIELQLQSLGSNVQKLFHVKNGADPGDIRVSVEGTTALSVDDSGALAIATPHGPIRFTRPLAYQFIDRNKQTVEVSYNVVDKTYGFIVGTYDKTKELIIDPLLASTYLGGNISDGINQISTNENDNVLVTGYTWSNDLFNVVSAEYKGLSDIFVAKFQADLSEVIAYTYIGGQYDDYGENMSLALNNQGEVESVYVVGYTQSPDIPATGYDDSWNGGSDVFLAQLSPGLTLFASTYLGGPGIDEGNAVIAYPGYVFVTGCGGDGLPIILGSTPYDDTYNGGGCDIFVARFNEDLSHLDMLTYLGGSETDEAYAMVMDESGLVYLTGETLSPDFPGTISTHNGNRDAFIAKMDWGLSNLFAANYFGGSEFDLARTMTIVGRDIIIAGGTESTDLPKRTNEFQGISDAFIARFSNLFLVPISSTYLGGSQHDSAFGIVDSGWGGIYVTGETHSPDFLISAGAYSEQMSSSTAEVFVTYFNLTYFIFSTYLGGASDDHGRCITIDSNSNIFVAGRTNSTDFPTTDTAFDRTYQKYDAFIAKLTPELSSANTFLEPVRYEFKPTIVIVDVKSIELYLHNVSLNNVPIKNISVTDPVNFDWSVTCTECCGGEVSANSSCKIVALFNPQSAGFFSTDIQVIVEDPDKRTLSSHLYGYGLLPDAIGDAGGGSNCFIATVTYGSYLHDDVKVLRDFRDEYLLSNSIGRKFVSAYYRYSPPIAEYIREDETRRMAAKWLLTPLVYAIKYPYQALLLMLATGVMVLVYRQRLKTKQTS